MKVDYFNIKIIDTHENNRELIIEDTQVDSPKLIYNGGDDKLGVVMTSELHFNFLVKDSKDAAYWHLFTGDETRYLVLLETEYQKKVTVIWQGFLLPEQFSEPWDSGGFFVELIASDGIGILKNKLLIGAFGKRSVLEIVMMCLTQTGLDLPLLFSPAFQNSGFNIDYKDLEIDASCYRVDGKVMNCYDVLQTVVKSLGCRLMQVDCKWVLIGLNKLSSLNVDFFEYNFSYLKGVSLVSKKEIQRRKVAGNFLTTPQISIVPPTSLIEVDWKANENEWVLPKDVVTAFPRTFSTNPQDLSLLYWDVVSDDPRFRGYTMVGYMNKNIPTTNLYSYYKGISLIGNKEKILLGPKITLVSYKKTSPKTGERDSFLMLADLDNNFLRLKESVFIYGSKERIFSLDVECKVYYNGALTREFIQKKIEDKVLEKKLHFTIVRKKHPTSDAEKVFSTLDEDLKGLFEFKLTADVGFLKANLSLNKFRFEESGFYNVYLYSVLEEPLLAGLVRYNKLHLKIDKKLDYLKKERNISGFSSEINESVFHNSSRENFSNRSFFFSDEFSKKIETGNLFRPRKLKRLFHDVEDVYNGSHFWYKNVRIGLFESDYINLKNGFTILRKKGDGFEEVDNKKYHLYNKGNAFEIRQVFFESKDFKYILKKEEPIYIAVGSSKNDISYGNYFIDKFKVLGIENSKVGDFNECLVSLYKWLTSRPFFRLQGEVQKYLNPIYLFYFDYNNVNDLYFSNLTINLAKGTSEVTLLEANNYIDSSDPKVIDEPIVDPKIKITTSVIKPNSLLVPWKVKVDYNFIDIYIIKASLILRHYKAHPTKGGKPSGYVVYKDIVGEQSGSQVVDFPIDLKHERRGWYSVSIKDQNKIESNVVFLEVKPLSGGAIIIKKEKELTATRELVFSAKYIDFQAKGMRLVYQELTLFTNQKVGDPVYKNVSELTSYKLKLKQGYFSVWLEEKGVVSNKIFVVFFV